jgi:LysR family transcriptional activator of glutamate synthase operon
MNEKSAAFLAPALAQLAALATDPNITRAAKLTATSQPTLSRALRTWEEELGVTILVQHGRGVELSDDGRMLAAAAAESLQTLDRALQRIRGTAREASLTVGFLRSLGPAVAGELIASFLLTRPHTVIVHREGSSSDLLDALDDGTVDLAITAPRPPERLSWLAVGDQALVLVVPASHRLAEASRVSLEEVREDAFLALDRRFDSRLRADTLCAAAGFAPRIVLEADDLMTIRGYIATGMGISILPADASLSPRTVSIPLTNSGARRTFGLAWDPARDSAPLEALVAHTREVTQKYPGWADILS